MKKRFRRPLLRAGLGVWLAAAAQMAWANTPELLIQGSLAKDGSLLMRYQPPAGVQELPFWPPTPHGAQAWRKKMASAADDCTELLPSALRLRAGCKAATLRVRPEVLNAYATYEPAQPQADGSGVLLHTGHYAVLLPGTALRWQWQAPAVLQRGAQHRGEVNLALGAAEVDAELQNSGYENQRRLGLAEYVFLGQRPAQDLGGAWLMMDAKVLADQAKRIRQDLLGSVQAYSKAYGQALPGSGALVVTLSELPGFHGDTTPGRMMRLRLPRDASTLSPEDLGLFVAHEAGHWWNSGLYRSDASRPWLHEGHAEWMALLQQAQTGQLAPQRWVERVEAYVNACLAARGDQVAAKLPTGRRGSEDYACGVSLMQLAQAVHASRLPGPETLLKRLASLHAGGAELTVARLQAWADGDHSGWLQRLLLDPEQGFASGLIAAMQAVGLAESLALEGSEPLNAGLRRSMATELTRQLMKADCAGASSFWSMNDGAQLDADMRCSTLRLGQRLTHLQGRSLVREPVEAWDAVHAACQRGDAIQAGYADGGKSQQPCLPIFPARSLRTVLKLRADAPKRWGFSEPVLGR
ncbi:hypothetical protein HNQ51_000514 [Inhella inkyongensis]|uniref:Peptidase M1 membrane alanine aminopeptidase domain-containing protein n=1 Tax=Inhella inkyongensis TaxID=392593 RepID=A0A840S3H6_9BURK|nr:hypothetical protein [Inhella inkyongensis]MBB5203221.1 hypothetical protein [Inhella inkyongensis]